MWVAAEPIAKEWLAENYGVSGRLKEVNRGAQTLGRVIAEAPRVLEKAEKATVAFADMAEGGLRIDDDSIERIARRQSRGAWWAQTARWIIAISLAVIAWSVLFE
ncbi:MAG: hypothetical protein AAGC70_04480 [Pseudomonadota bacterium]